MIFSRVEYQVDELQAVRNQIAEAQKIASGNGSEQDIAEAKIELEVSPHLLHTACYCACPLLTDRSGSREPAGRP